LFLAKSGSHDPSLVFDPLVFNRGRSSTIVRAAVFAVFGL